MVVDKKQPKRCGEANVTHYRIYESFTEPDKSPDGDRLEWTRGCNGENHVDHLDGVSYDKTLGHDSAEELIDVDQGPCDKSCGTISLCHGYDCSGDAPRKKVSQ